MACARPKEKGNGTAVHPPLRAFHTMTRAKSFQRPSMASIHAPRRRAVYIPLTRRRDDHHRGGVQCIAVAEREAWSAASGEEMELKAAARCLCLLAMILVAGLGTAHGAGECGRVAVDKMALKLAPCAASTQNPRAAVPPSCCTQIRAIGRNPKCLCAVMLSNTARQAGVKPAVAMTIPKRCAIANRPIGYKCGPYTLP